MKLPIFSYIYPKKNHFHMAQSNGKHFKEPCVIFLSSFNTVHLSKSQQPCLAGVAQLVGHHPAT